MTRAFFMGCVYARDERSTPMRKSRSPRRDVKEADSGQAKRAQQRRRPRRSPAVTRDSASLVRSPVRRLAIHSFWLGEAWGTLPKPLQALIWSIVLVGSTWIAKSVGVDLPELRRTSP